MIVKSFAEHADGVTLATSAGKFEAERLFIAGGVLPTTRLVLGSLGLVGHEVVIQDSQHFYLPMLHRWSTPDPAEEPRHTLAQAFWAIDDLGSSDTSSTPSSIPTTTPMRRTWRSVLARSRMLPSR